MADLLSNEVTYVRGRLGYLVVQLCSRIDDRDQVLHVVMEEISLAAPKE